MVIVTTIPLGPKVKTYVTSLLPGVFGSFGYLTVMVGLPPGGNVIVVTGAGRGGPKPTGGGDK